MGLVNAGSWPTSFAMEGFVKMVMPRPPQKDSEAKTQYFSSSVVFGRHVGAIVQGSLLGSMEAEELLFCNTWSWGKSDHLIRCGAEYQWSRPASLKRSWHSLTSAKRARFIRCVKTHSDDQIRPGASSS